MFERFTDRARRVLVEAQAEAVEARHGFIGTEHVLLGLAREAGGLAHNLLSERGLTLETLRPKVASLVAEFVANDMGIDEATALAAIGIDFERVRAAIEVNFGEGSLSADLSRPPFTPRSKEALERSLRESMFLRHNFIATEHLLIGFLGEPDGLARRAVAELGVDPDELIEETRRAAAPAFFRVSELYEAIRRFELSHTPAQTDEARNALLALSAGRVEAMQRETESINAATLALADELDELLRVAEATVTQETP